MIVSVYVSLLFSMFCFSQINLNECQFLLRIITQYRYCCFFCRSIANLDEYDILYNLKTDRKEGGQDNLRGVFYLQPEVE